MRKLVLYKVCSCILVVSLLGLTGCSKESDKLTDKQQVETQVSEEITQTETSSTEEILKITEEVQEGIADPILTEVD